MCAGTHYTLYADTYGVLTGAYDALVHFRLSLRVEVSSYIADSNSALPEQSGCWKVTRGRKEKVIYDASVVSPMGHFGLQIVIVSKNRN